MSYSFNDSQRENAEYMTHVEKTLAAKLELEELRTGSHVISNKKGWRENEKYVDYIWMVFIKRHFVGKGCLFSVKFAETSFREHLNKAEFVEGFFMNASDGKGHLYTDTTDDTVFDIGLFNKLDLFDANRGIALDGVGYDIRIIAPNIDTFINVGNPNSKEWIEWEKEIWKVGKQFGLKANDSVLTSMFS